MNKYDRERIDMITAMLMHISKLSANRISPYIKKTKIYSNILTGDELTLYDSYAANIMDMADEWKEKSNIPPVLRNITAEQVNASNTWLRTHEVKDARQAQALLALRPKPRRILKKRKKFSGDMSLIPIIRRMPKTYGRHIITVSRPITPAAYKKRSKQKEIRVVK